MFSLFVAGVVLLQVQFRAGILVRVLFLSVVYACIVSYTPSSLCLKYEHLLLVFPACSSFKSDNLGTADSLRYASVKVLKCHPCAPALCSLAATECETRSTSSPFSCITAQLHPLRRSGTTMCFAFSARVAKNDDFFMIICFFRQKSFNNSIGTK